MLSEIHQIQKTTFHREGNGEVTSRAWGKGIFQLGLLQKKKKRKYSGFFSLRLWKYCQIRYLWWNILKALKFLPSVLCVRVYVCVQMCMFAGMYMSRRTDVCMCMWRPETRERLEGLLFRGHQLWFLKHGLSLACSSPCSLDQMACKLKESARLCLPRTEITSPYHTALLLCKHWALNSGPHARTVSNFTSELSLLIFLRHCSTVQPRLVLN